jgi:hypothetical protein
MAVGKAFPTGLAFLLVKSSFPSLKTPTVLSQQELGNPIGKAFANRVGVFANILALLVKHAFLVVVTTDPRQIRGIIYNFYKQLFGSQDSTTIRLSE